MLTFATRRLTTTCEFGHIANDCFWRKTDALPILPVNRELVSRIFGSSDLKAADPLPFPELLWVGNYL
jgi:hypothetical protein